MLYTYAGASIETILIARYRGGGEFKLALTYHKLFHIPSWIPGRKMENAMYPDDKEMYRQVT